MSDNKAMPRIVKVQKENFSVAELYEWLSDMDDCGAVVQFIGKVRNKNLGDNVTALELEHYPVMTDKALNEIVDEASQRWELQKVAVVHRVGRMEIGEEIVFVGTTSPHRQDAYLANEFIMDYLKTRAPFWKKEHIDSGERWVEERVSDKQAAEKW